VKVTDDLNAVLIGFGGQHSNANGQLGNPLNGITKAEVIPARSSRPGRMTWRQCRSRAADCPQRGSGKAEYYSGIGTFTLSTSYNYTNATWSFLLSPPMCRPAAYYHQNSPNQTYQTELDLVSRKYGRSAMSRPRLLQRSQTFDPLNVTFNGPTVVSIYSKQTSHAIPHSARRRTSSRTLCRHPGGAL